MNEKTFRAAKSREQRRFYRAINQVIDQLLSQKFEQTRDLGEYRRYAETCNYVKGQIHLVDAASNNLARLFERQDERANWEVYLSGLRQLCRDLPDSYLFRFVLPMFGLEDVREKLVAYGGRWLEALHAGQTVLSQTERYLNNLERGEAIQEEYRAANAASEDLPRLYASLKTWESERELPGFYNALADFVGGTLEVLVLGPLQLYLMLGRDSFTLILKTLTAGRLADLKQGDAEYGEALALHDFLHGALADSITWGVLKEVAGRSGKIYADLLREEVVRLRAQLPTQELQRGFLVRYEAGAIFPRALDEG
ncbi:MAG: hypothetical protein M1401_06150 [Chloroflexi bacterium]|nr:hypothetical protein [Chloroflexota bacterium]